MNSGYLLAQARNSEQALVLNNQRDFDVSRGRAWKLRCPKTSTRSQETEDDPVDEGLPGGLDDVL
jgi:hypothetical protein